MKKNQKYFKKLSELIGMQGIDNRLIASPNKNHLKYLTPWVHIQTAIGILTPWVYIQTANFTGKILVHKFMT